MIDNYLIYEYKHFKGFFPGDSSGGGSGGGGDTFVTLSQGVGVSDTANSKLVEPKGPYPVGMNVKDAEGWTTANASCFGHYDWTLRASNAPAATVEGPRGCQYSEGTPVMKIGDPVCSSNSNWVVTSCVEGTGKAAIPNGNNLTKNDLDTGHTVAFNHKYWPDTPWNSQCGACIQIKYNDKIFNTKVVDLMQENNLDLPSGNPLRNIDINDNLFVKIFGAKTCGGSYTIKWKPIKCDGKAG